MSTRSGRIYNNMGDNSRDNQIIEMIRELSDKMDHRFNQVDDRIHALEIRSNTPSPRRTPLLQENLRHNPISEPRDSPPRRVRNNLPIDYRIHHNPDFRETHVPNVRIDVPTFSGSHDPDEFIDWLSTLERSFDWYVLSYE